MNTYIPPSLIHDKYSTWHRDRLQEISLKYKSLYMTDIDKLIYKPEIEGYRLWIEHDYKRPIAAMDLKWDFMNDIPTNGEKMIYNWLENKGLPCYIIYINEEFTKFEIKRKEQSMIFTEIEYAEWLLSLRFYNYQGI